MRPYTALTGLRRPVCFFFLPAFAVLLLPILLTPCWHALVNRIERQVKNDLSSQAEFHSSVLQSEFANQAEFLRPLNSSATNLARFLGSSAGEAALSFSEIETRVAPVLFQAFSTIPYLSQISYVGSDGLFFSYYTDGSQTLSLYSNSSSFVHDSSTAPNVGKNYVWYVQSVNNETGKLHGEAIEVPPLNMKNKSWFQEALNSTHGSSASLETGWNSTQVLVFLKSARINGGSVLSLGFPVKALTSIFTGIDLRGGRLDILAIQDRKVLFQGIPNTHLELSGNVVSFQLIKPNGDQIGIGNISCNLKDGTPSASTLNIQENEYSFYCLPLDIVGVQSVSVLAFPENGLVRLLHKSRKVAMLLLIVLIVTLVIFLSSFAFTILRAAKREMHLCANLIKQMEATQQAERKSMNKILAFASASHDVRAALAGITGLIEMCYDDVAPGSELDTNLRQMDTCANDLLGILNSILDTSKIEAGKMPLEEEEFDLEKLLEDVADLYHPVGIRKGVDVVLDPCDGSTKRFSQVKGDRGKLKQILCNLLSNAVKFTSEGHVTIRAWVKKPGLQNSINASKQNCLPCFLYKSSQAYNHDLEAVNTAQHDPNTMDYVFEVDDTGKGIPKDKQDSVFENYVQVKETALGQEGTGLGLGIVQSLVRLMHGDIGIVDKDVGEKGTCFRFNVLLTISETASSDNAKAEDLEMGGVTYLSGSISPAPSPQMPLRTPSPKSTVLTSSPKMKASHVVLLIQSKGRRRMLQRFMSNLGMKVSVVKQWDRLSSKLEKIKNTQSPSHQYNSIKSDLSSPSDNFSRCASTDSIAAEKDVPWSTMGGSDYIASIFKRTNDLRLASNFILTVIDASAGPLPEICRIVAEFRRGLHNTCCKAVWLDKPMMRSFNLKRNDDEEMMIDPNDIIISKPFHGSRLYEVVRLLPEFGGKMSQAGKLPRDPSSSRSQLYAENSPSPRDLSRRVELQDHHRSSSEIQGEKVLSQTENRSNVWPKSRRLRSHGNPPREQEILECGDPSNELLLRGKKILVAEDSALIRRLTVSQLAKLGATVEVSENGQEALELVSKGLTDQRKAGASMSLPYDYILMDCEMPILNGYQAAEEIRKMEKHFGVHTPIIALTAHTDEEAKKTIEAGMDVYIGKPLEREHLLEAIRYIENK